MNYREITDRLGVFLEVYAPTAGKVASHPITLVSGLFAGAGLGCAESLKYVEPLDTPSKEQFDVGEGLVTPAYTIAGGVSILPLSVYALTAAVEIPLRLLRNRKN